MQNPLIMRAVAIVLAFVLTFSLASAQQKDLRQLSNTFDKILSEQFKPHEPGATVLVARDGQIVYKKAFGMANLELHAPMQVDNVFWIASIGKQFTAVAILQLMEQGKLNLQDEITKFIPDYPTQGKRITIEHLLTHTSGIHNFSGMKDPDKKLALDCTPNEVIDFFKNLPMRFAPGTKWEYSNSGYFLLGYIIETITGKPYAEYLEENFFKPLGMTNSSYANDTRIIKNRVDAYTYGDNGFENSKPRNITHVYSAGAIQSTVEDLFKWHQAVHTNRLLKKENLDKAFTSYRLADGKETEYGYGWRLGYVYDSPSLWHGGLIAGFGTMELYLPEEDVFVTVFSNCDCNYPKDITFRLAALAAGNSSEYKEIALENSKLQEYTGLYENDKAQQRIITVSDDQLYSQLGRGPKSNLKAYQKDLFFFGDNAMQTIEFLRNTKGTIERLLTKKLDRNEVWKKTNKPLPPETGITVDGKILETYVGEYEIPSVFTFAVTKEENRLFLQGTGQDKIEMFADTETTFFLKVNDARIEFVRNDSGNVTKAILNQSGRTADARKTK
ncbi:MAG: serine hydrolase [Bacteroidetes bacterium]|nr:serine hydrolase [Bacteroidota bacterium]MCW5896788.1 serine hydrolase [Bacteroidota bacterium]